jgi:class 3 adenylate cyclase/putative methionine-R-sulfoxide reductase with GAF domain
LTQDTSAPADANAKARERALREVLQAISQSRDDEAPVFNTILRSAARLCDSPISWLLLVDENRTHFRFTASFGEDLREISIGEHWPLESNYLISQSINDARMIHAADIADSDLYRAGDPVMVRLVDEEGLRTRLHVPLVSAGQAIGCIVLSRREVNPFADDDIALVQTFAEQAVIAIENVRQYRELQTRLEREAATRQILEVISQSRDDDKPVFDVILENASRLCNAPLAMLSMADAAHERVHIPAYRGAQPEFAKILNGFDHPVATSPLFAVSPIREGRVIRIDDIADDDLYRSGNAQRVATVDVGGIRSVISVPLFSGDQAIGAIILYRREVAPFSDEDETLVKSFAAQAVIAVENVKQFKALSARTQEVQALNANLETRVEEQVGELERLGRLKRFLSPQVADAVVSSGDDKLLGSHRALIATLFCDIRGFTAFCETAEPEETIEVLQTYHEEMGKLINAHGAGVDHRAGDGIMVIFNDPLPCDDPAGDALRMALDMRARMADLCAQWKRLGHRLGFGVGISLGYATVGMVGSEGRYDYTASGTSVNLAARLCDEAADGDILLSPRAFMAVEDSYEGETIGALTLKGIHAPTEVFRVTGLKSTG